MSYTLPSLIIVYHLADPPKIVSVSPAGGAVVSVHNRTVLTCKAEGNPPPKYQWLQLLPSKQVREAFVLFSVFLFWVGSIVELMFNRLYMAIYCILLGSKYFLVLSHASKMLSLSCILCRFSRLDG